MTPGAVLPLIVCQVSYRYFAVVSQSERSTSQRISQPIPGNQRGHPISCFRSKYTENIRAMIARNPLCRSEAMAYLVDVNVLWMIAMCCLPQCRLCVVIVRRGLPACPWVSGYSLVSWPLTVLQDSGYSWYDTSSVKQSEKNTEYAPIESTNYIPSPWSPTSAAALLVWQALGEIAVFILVVFKAAVPLQRLRKVLVVGIDSVKEGNVVAAGCASQEEVDVQGQAQVFSVRALWESGLVRNSDDE
ncbi:hypothetical protein B0H17DRAFT_1269197 [Mycena rosella]|uniref:Uncharacterized protein n=1 Tax=Mycena rosella TaxID=1033263 RepID=A0AAD7CLV8_MYCRO|nr:hypothetical protein B0H17DRAFT_1269197 [Mycena rosella]